MIVVVCTGYTTHAHRIHAPIQEAAHTLPPACVHTADCTKRHIEWEQSWLNLGRPWPPHAVGLATTLPLYSRESPLSFAISYRHPSFKSILRRFELSSILSASSWPKLQGIWHFTLVHAIQCRRQPTFFLHLFKFICISSINIHFMCVGFYFWTAEWYRRSLWCRALRISIGWLNLTMNPSISRFALRVNDC